MALLKTIEISIKELPWIASRPFAGFANPVALDFYNKLVNGSYEADKLLRVLPEHRLIYVTVPKAASTRIRHTLARAEGRFMRSLNPRRRVRYRGPYGPRSITIGAFHRLATSRDTLRFSFVRNPYARVVSCWADKFSGKPLVGGDLNIEAYLAIRKDIDPALPAGPDRTLSFPEFVTVAAATAQTRHNIHLQSQTDILNMPGIKLDLIGRVETFNADFARVLDHLNSSDEVRREAGTALNESHHNDWPSYYTDALAQRVYRAYEYDFDHFGYARTTRA